MTDARRNEFTQRVEGLLADFPDVFIKDATMPVLRSWVIVAAFDDVQDDGNSGLNVIFGAHQWIHETTGLLRRAALLQDFPELTGA